MGLPNEILEDYHCWFQSQNYNVERSTYSTEVARKTIHLPCLDLHAWTMMMMMMMPDVCVPLDELSGGIVPWKRLQHDSHLI
jgi:hypothetical protein